MPNTANDLSQLDAALFHVPDAAQMRPTSPSAHALRISCRRQNQTRLIPFPIHIPDNSVSAARHTFVCRIMEISPLRGRSSPTGRFFIPVRYRRARSRCRSTA
nr:hypothetical protein [Burkholderia multivorans]